MCDHAEQAARVPDARVLAPMLDALLAEHACVRVAVERKPAQCCARAAAQ